MTTTPDIREQLIAPLREALVLTTALKSTELQSVLLLSLVKTAPQPIRDGCLWHCVLTILEQDNPELYAVATRNLSVLQQDQEQASVVE